MFFPYMTAAGLAIFLVATIFLGYLAFRTKLWWGLGYSTVPFVGLAYLYYHWDDGKKPFFVQLGGLGAAIAGYWVVEGF